MVSDLDEGKRDSSEVKKKDVRDYAATCFDTTMMVIIHHTHACAHTHTHSKCSRHDYDGYYSVSLTQTYTHTTKMAINIKNIAPHKQTHPQIFITTTHNEYMIH